jgi:hypothetical protein
MRRFIFAYAILLALTIPTTSTAGDEEIQLGHRPFAGESDFYRFSTDGPVQIAAICDGKITQLQLEDLQAENWKWESPLLILASEIALEDDGLRAQNCQFIMKSQQAWIRGQASRFQYAQKTQTASLTDAEIRLTVAVVGPDLTDMSRIAAKRMTVDLKNSQIKCESAAVGVDFSARHVAENSAKAVEKNGL